MGYCAALSSRHRLEPDSLVGWMAYFLPTYQLKKKSGEALTAEASRAAVLTWLLDAVGCMRERASLSAVSALCWGSEGSCKAHEATWLPTTTQHMQLESVGLAHRRTLCSIWQACTGSGRPPWSARCFATTAGLLSCPSALLCGCRFSHAVIMLLCLAEAAPVCLFFRSSMERINWQMFMCCFVNCGTSSPNSQHSLHYFHMTYNSHHSFWT